MAKKTKNQKKDEEDLNFGSLFDDGRKPVPMDNDESVAGLGALFGDDEPEHKTKKRGRG